MTDIKIPITWSAARSHRPSGGLTTNQLVPVNSIILSPNHWNGKAIGNKHWFFILKGAKNPEPVRGFYNEFLNPALEKHRKVFEVLADKIKAPVEDDQMSGIGVSSTRSTQTDRSGGWGTLLQHRNQLRRTFMEYFVWATRNKARFPSPRGELTVEDLWTCP